ncbi:Nuclease domain protein [Candidatus Megaera venefica]|uniref:Nuclease domain protein n=1 Tax=Candidatus Megaera venefica TaxID=2055910 RepID=A0ABU5NEY2_9RICK|nr:HEPN domain-containing protein [Candidatus Megaera venefica]MEA0971721.1 Nuclease domain protein [Candidatus Megaera venefica]
MKPLVNSGGESFDGGTKYCFCVNIKKCSPSMAYDIARWHVDTAISLARLYGVLNSHSISCRHFDSIVERSAYTYNRNTDNASLIMNNTGSVYAISTHKTQKFYEIKSTTKDTIGKTNFIDACNKIYNAKQDSVNAKQELSVYERIERALGWMTKARTSIDIATKFLLFFTALEALMPEIKTHTICTKNKKCSKVDAVCTKTEECKEQKVGISENLAQCITTICSATPNEREELKKEVKECYSIRSSLVHSGSLNVSEEDCKKLETYTEYVCYWFLEHAIASNKPYDEIITKLANAWNEKSLL